tara:strand:+ start:178 stop:318 length:141 start_codon:yes stop_codon:yes gene_type:complete
MENEKMKFFITQKFEMLKKMEISKFREDRILILKCRKLIKTREIDF